MTSKKPSQPSTKIIHTLQIPLTDEGRKTFLSVLAVARCGSYSGMGANCWAAERAMIESLRKELGAYCSECGELKREEET